MYSKTQLAAGEGVFFDDDDDTSIIRRNPSYDMLSFWTTVKPDESNQIRVFKKFIHPEISTKPFRAPVFQWTQGVTGSILDLRKKQDVELATAQLNHVKQKLLKDILSFKALNNNWDGYGALPLEIDSATKAILLINTLEDNSLKDISEIFPNPNGTISIIWNSLPNNTISLDIGNESMSFYVKFGDSEPLFFNDKEINLNEINNLEKYIQFL